MLVRPTSAAPWLLQLPPAPMTTMRIISVLAVALASRQATAEPAHRPAARLGVTWDASHLDLEGHLLRFKVARAVQSADLVAIGEDGDQIGTGSATYSDEPVNSWLSISWTQKPGARVMILKLHVVAADGNASNVELVPWSVTIDHDDVKFRTDSSTIDRDQEAKLDASLAEIDKVVRRSQRFMKMTLYVAGHTDTVGSAASNRKLSLARARAIASYLRRKGVAIPIRFAGFGEDVLKVKTAQETDAPANRRADYVIGPSSAPPPFKGAYLKARARWQSLP